jgi:hypothetical protein
MPGQGLALGSAAPSKRAGGADIEVGSSPTTARTPPGVHGTPPGDGRLADRPSRGRQGSSLRPHSLLGHRARRHLPASRKIAAMTIDLSLLPGLRLVGDAEADAVISDFVASAGIDDPRSLMIRLVRTADLGTSHAAVPNSLARYLDTGIEAIPAWCDDGLVRRGQQFFEDWGLAIATGLFCASLPTAYLSSQGAQVIAITGELPSDESRKPRSCSRP